MTTTIFLLFWALCSFVLVGLGLVALFTPDNDGIDPMQEPFGDVPEVRS